MSNVIEMEELPGKGRRVFAPGPGNGILFVIGHVPSDPIETERGSGLILRIFTVFAGFCIGQTMVEQNHRKPSFLAGWFRRTDVLPQNKESRLTQPGAQTAS